MCTTCEKLVQALNLCPCSCQYQYLYWPRGDLKKECPRCRALRQFKEAHAEAKVEVQA